MDKKIRTKSKHMWNHLTDVSYCDICNKFAHDVGYKSECVTDEGENKEDIYCVEVETFEKSEDSKYPIRKVDIVGIPMEKINALGSIKNEEVEYKVNSEKLPTVLYEQFENVLKQCILEMDRYNTDKGYYYIVIKVKI